MGLAVGLDAAGYALVRGLDGTGSLGDVLAAVPTDLARDEAAEAGTRLLRRLLEIGFVVPV